MSGSARAPEFFCLAKSDIPVTTTASSQKEINTQKGKYLR